MSLLNCFLAFIVVWSSIGCQCNPFERPKTAGEQVKFIEAYYQVPTVVPCKLGQICLIPLWTVNRNSTEPIVYPINITFVTGEAMKWSFSENNLFVLPLTTGMSFQIINHFDVRKEPVEFSYEVNVLEEHPHNHQFEITLNQPNLTIFNHHQENFIDFIKTLARALDISITRLTVDKIFPREHKMVFVIHDNRVPVFWCDMDSINAVKYKMISWFGGLKNDFTSRMGGQFEIDTVELQKIGICYKSFTSYLKHIGLEILIFLGFIVLMLLVCFISFQFVFIAARICCGE